MKRKIARLVIQLVGLCFGVLGALWAWIGVTFAFSALRGHGQFEILWFTPLFLAAGAVLLIIAYRGIVHFDQRGVRHITALAVIALYTKASVALQPIQDAAWEMKDHLLHTSSFFIPILFAYLIYLVVSRKLIELTETTGIQQGN